MGCNGLVLRREKPEPPMSQLGHFRQIDPLPTLLACPLRSDRVRTFAPQRIDAVCHNRTRAVQQNLLMMFQRRLSCVGRIGNHHFLRNVHNPR
jgi:hypothetical protein